MKNSKTNGLSGKIKQVALVKLTHIKMDGLSNIVQTSQPLLAIMWATLLIVNASLCTYLIICTFNQYNSHQVSTTIRWVSEQRAVFPTVTICSFNPIASESALNLVDRFNLSSNLVGATFQTYIVYSELEHNLKNTRGSYLNESERADLFDLDMMLVGCMFQGGSCNSSDFELSFNPYYLNCYRFNPRGDKLAHMSGLMSGLFLDLFANPPPIKTNALRGLNIFIHNATTYPFDFKHSPYQLTVGLSSNYIINRVFTKQYEKPYSDCVVLEENRLIDESLADRSLFDQVVKTGYSYSQSACLTLCQQEFIAKDCGCLSPGIYYTIADLDWCYEKNQSKCADQKYLQFLTSDYIYDTCLPKCPLECSYIQLVTTISTFLTSNISLSTSTVFPNPNFYSKYGEQIEENELTNNVIQIGVYYETLSYMQVEEEPKMSFEDLIGSLGGHLHLFLGMSLLSFAEILEFTIVLLATAIGFGSRQKAQQKIIHVNQT